MMCRLHIAQHIRYELTPLPFGTLRPKGAMSYMLEPLRKMSEPALRGES
jgi:hypothetical protein